MENPKINSFNQEEFESWKERQVTSSNNKRVSLLTYLLEIPLWLVSFVMQDMWASSSGMGEMMDNGSDIQNGLHWQSFAIFFGLIVTGIIIYLITKK